MSSDKSTGQWVGTIVGGVIGFVTGGPAGAFRGAVIGASLGGYIDPPKGPNITGPRLEDLNYQYANYGQPLGRHYGTMASMGSVIWLENDKIKETSRKQKVGGKGGGSKQTLETFSYFATFAVAFNDGEIAGVRRIWINGQLHYNAASNDLATIIASNQNAEGFRIYRGTDDQEPDPRIEADMGVGNTPAFRGTAYIVFYDLPLEKYGNTLAGAQIKVECYTRGDQAVAEVVEFFDDPEKEGAINCAMFPPALSASKVFGLTVTDADVYRSYSYGVLDQGYGLSVGPMPLAGAIDRYCGPANNILMVTLANLGVKIYLDGDAGTEYGSIFYSGTHDAFDTGETIYVVGVRETFRTWSVECKGRINSAVTMTLDPDGTYGGKLISVGYDAGELFVYTRGNSRCYVLDADSLSLKRTLDLSANGSGSNQYIYVDNGIIYNPTLTNGGTSTNQLLRGFSVADGSVVYERVLPEYEDLGFTSPFAIYGGLMLRYSPTAGLYESPEDPGRGMQIVHLNYVNDLGVPLAQIISDLCERSEYIDSSDLELSAIEETVRGYRVAGVMDARSAIGPLQGVYAFDVFPSGYQIKFQPRGQESVATISLDILDARNFGDSPGERLTVDRQMDSQLPRQVMLRHIDPERDYEPNEQPSTERLDARTTRINNLDMPVALLPDEAAGVAQKLFDAGWLEREEFKFSLPPFMRALEPCDVLTIIGNDVMHEVRLGDLSFKTSSIIDVSAKPNGVALWTPSAVGGQGSISDGTVILIGESTVVLMDIPMIIDAMDAPGFTAAMFGFGRDRWPGGVLTVSNDTGQTFEGIEAFADQCSVAVAVGSLGESDCLVTERGTTLSVRIVGGDLDSVSEAQMMAGMNACAYGVDGRWEIIQFANAVLQPDGSYLLSTFIRGLRGTEWASGLHEPNDWLVLLNDTDVSFVGSNLAILGVERIYRAVTVGADVQDADDTLFTYRGVNLKPLSVVHVSGVRPENDWIISFVPRTRYTSSAWVTGVEPPNDEPLRFEVDIIADGEVVRTLTAGGDTVIYSGAQQIEDFGFIRSVLTIVVYQVSARVGRGYPTQAVIGEGLPLGIINFVMVDGSGPAPGTSIEFVLSEGE